MSKIKNLKNYLKSYSFIFDRITNGYKLNAPASFLYNYLDLKGKDGAIKIDLVGPNVIKVLKKEQDKRIVETVNFKYDEIVSSERIKYGSTKENILRKYSTTELLSLESTITLRSGQSDETKIRIRIEKDKVYVNDRDVTPLYAHDNQSIEERYASLQVNYTKQHEEVHEQQQSKPQTNKSKRQIVVEEQLRDFIREEFDYKAPLDKRDLEDLLRIMDMLIKRRKTTNENHKQYKKI